MAGDAIRVDVRGLDAAKEYLGSIKKGYEKAVSRAQNKTVITARALAKKEILKDWALKSPKYLTRAITIKKARLSYLEASVNFTAKGLPLAYFKFLYNEETGVSVRVKKSGGYKPIKRAFVAKMKSGHVGIFLRKRNGWARQPLNKNLNYGALPNKYKKAMELYSADVAGMLEADSDKTMARAISRARIAYDKYFAAQVSLLMGTK